MALQRRSSVEWRQRRALHALIAAALMLRSSVAHTHQFSPLSLRPSFLPLRQSVSPRFSPDLSIDAVSWPYKSLPKSYPVSAVCRRPVRPWSQLGCRLPCRIQSLPSCQRICWRYGRDAGQLEDPRPDVNFEIHSWTYRLSGLPF